MNHLISVTEVSTNWYIARATKDGQPLAFFGYSSADAYSKAIAYVTDNKLQVPTCQRRAAMSAGNVVPIRRSRPTTQQPQPTPPSAA